jgi:hypothetical protein
MNITTTFVRRPFRVLAGAAIALGVLAAASTLNPESASAWSTSTSGSPGFVAPGYVTGTYGSQGGYYIGTWRATPALYVPGAGVYRSPLSTGTQWVRYVVTVEQMMGGGYWQATGIAQTFDFQIPAGWSGVTAPAFKQNASGLVRVKIGVVWFTPNWQQLLGARVVVMDQNSDYLCDSTQIFCTQMWGGVNLASY